jgi:hypothetical protein
LPLHGRPPIHRGGPQFRGQGIGKHTWSGARGYIASPIGGKAWPDMCKWAHGSGCAPISGYVPISESTPTSRYTPISW